MRLTRAAACTGLRQSELLALRWEDLDPGKGELHVRQTVQYGPRQGFQFGVPLTQAGSSD